MKQTIIVHGSPSKEEFYKTSNSSMSNTVWYPWLQKQICFKDEISQALEFPRPYNPVYEEWAEVIKNFQINEQTTLIGHSCGGGFLLRYLSENKNLKPKKVVLVAPWIDTEKELLTGFFDFEIDPDLNKLDIHIFMSLDDLESGMQESFRIIKNKLSSAKFQEYEDRGHFCDKEFPEILEVI